MLESIYVKNLALIEECGIDFKEGLNILTGETGAGKSVLIGSVNLALGARADKDMIRTGAEDAFVSISFSESAKARTLLDSWDIPCDDGTIVISRKISATKNIFKINGEIANARQVKELAEYLIDIHGQHEHQSLLNNARQLEMLDAYGMEKIAPALEKCAESAGKLKALREELSSLSERQKGSDREIDLLSYEIKEIDDANLIPGEDEELEEKYKIMQAAGKNTELLNEALNCVSGDDSGDAGSLISRAIQSMNRVKSEDERITSALDKLSEAEELLGDFSLEISRYLSDTDFSEEEFKETEERLNLINTLKNRYGATVDEILKTRDEKENELLKLRDIDSYREKIKKECEEAEALYTECARSLSKLRTEAAKRFSKELETELKELSFSTVSFNIEVTPDESKVSNLGFDSCEFMISVNLGEPLKPMKNVSSGGELSRIMLAIKTILAEKDDIDSLIFDEIDAGISGRTAWEVSGKLNRLSRKHQVIAITHLAQIAAMADAHFEIKKTSADGKTVTNISMLDREGEIGELARLIGADEQSEATLTNAKELKDRADAEKKR